MALQNVGVGKDHWPYTALHPLHNLLHFHFFSCWRCTISLSTHKVKRRFSPITLIYLILVNTLSNDMPSFYQSIHLGTNLTNTNSLNDLAKCRDSTHDFWQTIYKLRYIHLVKTTSLLLFSHLGCIYNFISSWSGVQISLLTRWHSSGM